MNIAPERQAGFEILDDPSVDPEVMKRSMRDVAKANRLFGGKRAALAEVMPALEEIGDGATLLDVGTGHGDIPRAVHREASRQGYSVRTIGMDSSLSLVSSQRDANDSVMRADALCIPLRDHSVDVVLASQILHHFRDDAALTFIRELNRVARKRVVISDLRRSRVAAAGLWIGSFPLRFHPVSRHDGVVSVMRGFLPEELEELVHKAIGHRPDVTRRLGFRLTTSWKPR